MTPKEKKEAKRLYDIEYRKLNATKISKYKKTIYSNLTDEERTKLHKLRYAALDKKKKKKDDKEYATKNKIKLNDIKKKWALANKDKVKKAKADYVKKKLKSDLLYKLKHNIGCSIRQSFKRNGYTKNAKTFNILGCTFEEFKTYLEHKFEPWMNWNNHGNPNGIPKKPNVSWDIDHIIPLASATCEEDVIKLNHYTNLQPLCGYINRWIKSNNY